MGHLYVHSVVGMTKAPNICLYSVNFLELSGKKFLAGYVNAVLKRYQISVTDRVNIMFGLFDCENHFILLNHIVLIAM